MLESVRVPVKNIIDWIILPSGGKIFCSPGWDFRTKSRISSFWRKKWAEVGREEEGKETSARSFTKVNGKFPFHSIKERGFVKDQNLWFLKDSPLQSHKEFLAKLYSISIADKLKVATKNL